MKTLGIIGGIGPESTIAYYRLIIAAYREHKRDGSYPSFFINSINLTKMRALIEANDRASLTNFLLSEVTKLAQAGADFGLLAAVTPHIVFEELQRQSPIPLISIVETACAAVKARGLTRVGLLGTRFTMQGRFFTDIFSRENIAVVVPEPNDQEYVHDKYMSELVNGLFLDETRDRLLAIVDRLKVRAGIEGVILGGTEMPLILRDDTHNGIPFLDTAKIHAERAVEQMLS